MIYFALYLLVERFFSVNEGSFQWAFFTVPVMNALFAPLIFSALDFWMEVWDMTPEEH